MRYEEIHIIAVLSLQTFLPVEWLITFLIVYVNRSPDASNVRDKMLYASTKDRFKKELDGIQVDLQATEPCEMSMEIVKERATTTTTN